MFSIMRKIASKIFILLFILSAPSFTSNAGEILKERDTEINIFTGMFDFSDTKQRAGLFGNATSK